MLNINLSIFIFIQNKIQFNVLILIFFYNHKRILINLLSIQFRPLNLFLLQLKAILDFNKLI